MNNPSSLPQADFADTGSAVSCATPWAGDDGAQGYECALPFLCGVGDGWPRAAESLAVPDIRSD